MLAKVCFRARERLRLEYSLLYFGVAQLVVWLVTLDRFINSVQSSNDDVMERGKNWRLLIFDLAPKMTPASCWPERFRVPFPYRVNLLLLLLLLLFFFNVQLPKVNLTKTRKLLIPELCNETWRCDHSNESSQYVLSNGGIHVVLEQSSCFCNFYV